jgi:hypothetical protein
MTIAHIKRKKEKRVTAGKDMKEFQEQNLVLTKVVERKNK